MPMIPGCVTEHFLFRTAGRVLLSLVMLGLVQAAVAQQSVTISPSVVLVLKLVSSTLVKPTTGIVVSDDGLVLVPAEFATQDGEMIVLDGGADILSNGRPAKLVAWTGSGDLAVLSVKGLKRPGISLAGDIPDTAGDLHLEAFPPAEYIAQGAQPLRLPVSASRNGQTGQYSVSSMSPLPYVTGAIVDACGNLAGISMTSGPQSLDGGESATFVFGSNLGRLLDDMQVTLPTAVCKSPAAEAVAPVAATAGSGVPDDLQTPPEPVAENKPETTIEPGAPEAADKRSTESPAQDAVAAETPRTAVAGNSEPVSIWDGVPVWLPWLAIIVLGVLIWKAVFFFRLSGQPPARARGKGPVTAVQPASDEPDTAPLDTGIVDNALKPRSVPVMDFEIPPAALKPDGCDGLLLVEGMLDADTSFRRFCFVDTGHIDAVIGRGDADIAIEHAAISRAHARIRTEGDCLTFSDLGSRNGSFIGDTPCLQGEVMYLEADDEVYLGDLKITLRVVTQVAEWA